MFKSLVVYRSLRALKPIRQQYICPTIRRYLSSDEKPSDQSISEQLFSETNEKQTDEIASNAKTLTFAKAFEKFEKMVEESKTPKPPESFDSESFPTLLRYSTFVQMGDPEDRIAAGRIVDIVEDDLYIDFGGKFNAVCKRPRANQSDYVRGAKVKLRINDLELCDRFLGSSIDMTLLEADATLLGLIWSPTRGIERKDEPEVDSI